jgi:hypothetical protein
MNTIKTLIATLGLAASIAPALANDGIPADLQTKWSATSVRIDGSRSGAQPAFLPGIGELTVVRNPAFVSPRVERTDRAEIRRHSVPATRYVGA